LNEIEELAIPLMGRSNTIDFRVGDIVTYRLKESERDKYIHFSLESKYNATRSFPQRVTKVTPHDVEMIPLWTRGQLRRAPKEQCKLIATFIPELLRMEARLLYPYLPWLTTDAKESRLHSTSVTLDEEPEANSGEQLVVPKRQHKRFRPEEDEAK
jgi:hypothetical protein